MGSVDSIHFTMALDDRKRLSSYADVIDSRQVIDRVEELTAEIEAGSTDPDVGREFEALNGLLAGFRSCVQYERQVADGMTAVRETYWVEHITERTGDCWVADWYEEDPFTFKRKRLSWEDITSRAPFNYIDWAAYARDCRTDCSEFEYDGVTYIVD